MFIHANDTHAFTPSWIINQQAHPFGQDSSVRGIPGHTEGLGDTRHRQMMNDQPTSAQRTAARESLAHGSAAWLISWRHTWAHSWQR